MSILISSHCHFQTVILPSSSPIHPSFIHLAVQSLSKKYQQESSEQVETFFSSWRLITVYKISNYSVYPLLPTLFHICVIGCLFSIFISLFPNLFLLQSTFWHLFLSHFPNLYLCFFNRIYCLFLIHLLPILSLVQTGHRRIKIFSGEVF